METNTNQTVTGTIGNLQAPLGPCPGCGKCRTCGAPATIPYVWPQFVPYAAPYTPPFEMLPNIMQPLVVNCNTQAFCS